MYVFLPHTLAVKVNWKFLCFILLCVAWKSIRVDPMLICCYAFNLSVDFCATVCVCVMYVHHVVTEQDAVSVIILYLIHSSFIYFNSIIFNRSVGFLLLVRLNSCILHRCGSL
jgi:hypothetical protein